MCCPDNKQVAKEREVNTKCRLGAAKILGILRRKWSNQSLGCSTLTYDMALYALLRFSRRVAFALMMSAMRVEYSQTPLAKPRHCITW